MRCSNPSCRCLTTGPRKGSTGSVNIGVAAHITAASEGGPRFDPSLTKAERVSLENAIWLCQNCAALIDRDTTRFDAALLKAWRQNSEEAALLDMGARDAKRTSDKKIIQFFSVCLDRPAFIDRFYQERSTEAFDKAIEDTITAFNTGALRSRDGVVLQTGRGKSYLSNSKLREKIDTVVAILRAIRIRYENGKNTGEIEVRKASLGEEGYIVRDPALAEWFDHSRLEALSVFKSAADLTGVDYRVPADDYASKHWLARNTKRR
jgi:hypothetical protein